MENNDDWPLLHAITKINFMDQTLNIKVKTIQTPGAQDRKKNLHGFQAGKKFLYTICKA